VFRPLLSSHYSTRPIDDLAGRPDANDVPEYPAQDESDETPTSEGLNQVTTEQRTDNAGSGIHSVDRFDEGESSNEAEPERVQPAGDEDSIAGPLSGDEHTEQPVGVAEGDREQGTATATASDDGYPGSGEDPDAAAVHDHSDVRNPPPLGGNSTEYEEVAATNEDYEADYNENDQDSDPGEKVAIGNDARGGDWETTTSDAQQTQDDLEQHEIQGDAARMDNCEQMVCITIADDLTPHPQIPMP